MKITIFRMHLNSKAPQNNNNQSGFSRQRRKFILLSASHSTRVSIPTHDQFCMSMVGTWDCGSDMDSADCVEL